MEQFEITFMVSNSSSNTALCVDNFITKSYGLCKSYFELMKNRCTILKEFNTGTWLIGYYVNNNEKDSLITDPESAIKELELIRKQPLFNGLNVEDKEHIFEIYEITTLISLLTFKMEEYKSENVSIKTIKYMSNIADKLQGMYY